MRKYLLQLVGLAVLCITIYSCKLDKPILPGDPNYVAVPPPGGGTGGITTPIDNAALTGKWKVVQTNTIFYTDGVPSTADAITFFTDAEMDDAAKTTTFDGQFTLPSDEVSYTLSTSNNNNYLQFSADVFQRSSNDPVQIVSFSGTAMTWLAPDPLVHKVGSQSIKTAYQVKFVKE